jgi:hypothetical protein
MRADNSRHLIAAARRRREQTQARARQALQDLTDLGQQISIAAVAARAGVSRAWLYAEPELRQQIQVAASNPRKASPGSRDTEPSSDASLRQRLTLAHQHIRQLTEDNQLLRDQIARLHGQLRLAKLATSVTDTVHDTNQQPTPTTRSSSSR